MAVADILTDVAAGFEGTGDEFASAVLEVLDQYGGLLEHEPYGWEARGHSATLDGMNAFGNSLLGTLYDGEEVWGKHLPYNSDWDTVRRMQDMGYRLYRDPTIHNAIEVLISYVINKGWSYALMPRPGGPKPRRGQIEKARTTLEAMLQDASLGASSDWYVIQEETYRRLLRDGEYFRRWFVRGGVLQVRFLEVQYIRQPDSLRQVVNREAIPAELFGLQQGSRLERYDDLDVPGMHGVVVQRGDDADEAGYFYETGLRGQDGSILYRWIPASELQHQKIGCDANDPRGVPAFYQVACWVNQLNLVVKAAAELAITQSEYAVVHKPRAGVLREQLKARLAERAAERNRAVSGGKSVKEQHMMNTDVELHGMKVNARNYVEIVQQLQRLVGSVRQIPEFMITNDANTGNRSSLTSAEGPLVRRVGRDQRTLWPHDQRVLTGGLWRIHQYSAGEIEKANASMRIVPCPPFAETKDPAKDAKTVKEQLESGTISPQEAARRTNVDPHQMAQERREWDALYPAPEEREEAAATGQNQNPES